MKKTLYIIGFLVVLGCFQGCQREIISDIKGNADDRVNEQIREWQKIMTDAENGWFANIMTVEGVYRFWMDFESDGAVTMYTDNLRYKSQYEKAPETTTYRIEQYQRPTLIFDIYSYLSILNDPNNDISGGQDNQGLVTDFEFEFVGYADNEFELTGRINRVPATLVKATAEEYAEVTEGRMMARLEDLSNFIGGKTFEIEVGGKSVPIIMRQRQVVVLAEETGGIQTQRANSYVEIDGDIHFMNPIKVGNVTLLGIKWDEEAQKYTEVLSSGTTYELKRVDAPKIPLHQIFGIQENAVFQKVFYDNKTMTSLSNSISGSIGTYNLMMGLLGVLAGVSISVNDASLSFGYGAEGAPVLILGLGATLGSAGETPSTLEATISFDGSFNEDMSLFTVRDTYYADSYADGLTMPGSFASDFLNRTFEIKWTTDKVLGEYLLGEITRVVQEGETNTTAYRFVGAVME